MRGKKHVISILKLVVKTVTSAVVPTSIRVMVKSAGGMKVELRLLIPNEGIVRVLEFGATRTLHFLCFLFSLIDGLPALTEKKPGVTV